MLTTATRRKPVFLWALYDFAVSISTMAFLLYFSQWMVVNHGIADFWYNAIFIVSSLLLLASGPVTAVIADRSAAKVPFWQNTTLLQFAFLLIASVVASYFAGTTAMIVVVIVCYTLSNYFHQFAMIFYNALLPDVSDRKSEGTISGLGQFGRWMGTVVGLLVIIPFAHASYHFLGAPGRSQTFLPATLISLALVIPALFLRPFANDSIEPRGALEQKLRYMDVLKKMLQQPGVGRYLLSFFFFNDAMLTLQHNMPIYMERVLGASDKVKSLVLAGGLGTAAIGGLVGGWVSDRLGQKFTLLGTLAAWTIFIPMLGLTQNIHYFAGLALLMGFLFGLTWTVTRSVMVYLSPLDQMNHTFSYYTLAERFATFVGPLTWSIATAVLANFGNLRYRVAMFSMAAFVLLGLVLAIGIPSDKEAAFQKPKSDEITPGVQRVGLD